LFRDFVETQFYKPSKADALVRPLFFIALKKQNVLQVIKLLPIFAEMKIEKVWLTETAVWIRTDEGKEACELFADYPRLRYATKEQLVDFTTDEFGIHWEELDEDLSFEGFFEKQEPTALYQLFMAHPELNVSALARRIGISQSLMAQYISGKKNASKARMALILDTIHAIGLELAAV
jgi:hypothetical protein